MNMCTEHYILTHEVSTIHNVLTWVLCWYASHVIPVLEATFSVTSEVYCYFFYFAKETFAQFL
jgi:hypothetical protein